jgi:hypothetical protein
MHLPENSLDEGVDDSASRVALLVGDVEPSQGLSESDRKDHEQDAEDGRFLQSPRTSVSSRQRHKSSQAPSHLEHAPNDDLHDTEETEKVEDGEKFGPDQRRCHREPFCGYRWVNVADLVERVNTSRRSHNCSGSAT